MLVANETSASETGVSGWIDSTLGEFVSLRRGHDLTGAQRSAGSVPVMGAAGQNGWHDTAIKQGPGVVLGRSGAAYGQVHFCKDDFWPHNTALYVTDFHDNDPLFAFYFLNALDFSRFNSGGAQPSLNRNFIYPIEIRVPSDPAEQRAIAEALSDVDALINVLDALITKKRHIKQGTMQQLLTGKQRLPGFSGEWEDKPLDNSIDLLTGYPFSSTRYVSSGIRLLRGSNVKRGETDWSENATKCWPELTPDLHAYQLRVGDVVIAMDGYVGKSFARIVESDLPALLLQRVARIRSEVFDVGYLHQHFASPAFVSHCDQVKTATAIAHISPADIRAFSVPTPPSREEQTAIAEVLSDMDAEITALEQKRDKTKLIKQGMMQELLTGKTRLI